MRGLARSMLAHWRDRDVRAQISAAIEDGILEQYGNTLPRAVNERYMTYWRACAGTERAAGWRSLPVLAGKPFVHVRSAIAPALAAVLSQRVSQTIESGHGIVVEPKTREFLVNLARPVSQLGADVLCLFDGETGACLREQYGSEFRILWADCYRASHASSAGASWLWHFDNVPLPALKVILYLTGTRDTLATTRIIDFETSQRLKRGGYFGLGSGDRVTDIEALAAHLGIACAVTAPEMEAGDALVFHTNCFHQAVLPARGFRDSLTFFILPARNPWRANLARRRAESIEWRQGGFPPDPSRLDGWGELGASA